MKHDDKSPLNVRVSPKEKETFLLAAEIAGISLSDWMRERLRLAARRELEDAHEEVPFMPVQPLCNNDE